MLTNPVIWSSYSVFHKKKVSLSLLFYLVHVGYP